jgi:uncharacterized glyoxalase superfamily protein PhnB
VSEGESSFRFNTVCSQKKTHGLQNLSAKDLIRPCCNFRHLNSRIVKESSPIQNTNELLDQFHGKRFFSTLDMTSAYWGLHLDQDSKKYTAFTGKMGKL